MRLNSQEGQKLEYSYPKAMAARTQELARLIVSEYDGDAASLWTTAPSGAELLKRVSALPGFECSNFAVTGKLLTLVHQN